MKSKYFVDEIGLGMHCTNFEECLTPFTVFKASNGEEFRVVGTFEKGIGVVNLKNGKQCISPLYLLYQVDILNDLLTLYQRS